MFQVSLKAARVNANFKQKDAAQLVGVDSATIIKWEKGKTSPKADQLKRLCDIYSIPIDCIFLSEKSTLSERNIKSKGGILHENRNS